MGIFDVQTCIYYRTVIFNDDTSVTIERISNDIVDMDGMLSLSPYKTSLVEERLKINIPKY